MVEIKNVVRRHSHVARARAQTNLGRRSMKTSWLQSLFLASSAVALSALAAPALAQPGAPAAATPPGSATVQEIVVTAQRQAQSLLSVPMSISASTGEQLERAGLRDMT